MVFAEYTTEYFTFENCLEKARHFKQLLLIQAEPDLLLM